MERPSCRLFQVASCREESIAETDWKRQKNYRKANERRLCSTVYINVICRHMPWPLSLLSQLTTPYRTIIIEDDGLPIHFADVNGYS